MAGDTVGDGNIHLNTINRMVDGAGKDLAGEFLRLDVVMSFTHQRTQSASPREKHSKECPTQPAIAAGMCTQASPRPTHTNKPDTHPAQQGRCTAHSQG